MNESPLFIRTYDFLLWLLPQTLKFPRIHRFGLGERIQHLALDFQDTIVAAGKSKGTQRAEMLRQADIQLEQIRLWMRFAYDNSLFTIHQYEHAARLITEMGRLLGAWIKNHSGAPTL